MLEYRKEDTLIELVSVVKVNEDVLECVNNVECSVVSSLMEWTVPKRAALYEGSRTWWRSTQGPKAPSVPRYVAEQQTSFQAYY
jgi:hypothetical protein